MITQEERREALRSVKFSLASAHKVISEVAESFESKAADEFELWKCEEYCTICRVLGILGEETDDITNQLIDAKK